MKKIIKKSPKKFKAKCPKCWCKFTYEVEDIIFDEARFKNEVLCPSCGNIVRHIDNKLFVCKVKGD